MKVFLFLVVFGCAVSDGVFGAENGGEDAFSQETHQTLDERLDNAFGSQDEGQQQQQGLGKSEMRIHEDDLTHINHNHNNHVSKNNDKDSIINIDDTNINRVSIIINDDTTNNNGDTNINDSIINNDDTTNINGDTNINDIIGSNPDSAKPGGNNNTNGVEEKEPISILFEEPYQLPEDEEWPEEIAHLFASRPENEADASEQRRRRWAEWTTDDVEIREDSWDEPPIKGGGVRDPRDEPFVAYVVNDTYIMSRCSSGKMAKSLVIACPQPRGSKFHRIVHLSNVFYGWSQMDAKICQYVEGDCTLRYEYLHKQLMKLTIPQNEEEFRSLGPTYFCNSWDGDGREEWVMPTKRWCTIGMRRSSPSMDPLDKAANPWAQKYGYTWNGCGSGYDWFDYLQAEYTCIDIMEPIAEVPKPTKRPTCKPPITPPTRPPREDENDVKEGQLE